MLQKDIFDARKLQALCCPHRLHNKLLLSVHFRIFMIFQHPPLKIHSYDESKISILVRKLFTLVLNRVNLKKNFCFYRKRKLSVIHYRYLPSSAIVLHPSVKLLKIRNLDTFQQSEILFHDRFCI